MKRIITIAILATLSFLLSAQNKTDWDIFVQALINVESRNVENADDGHGCLGVLQITSIFVKEVNRMYGTDFTHRDALNRNKSILMFNLMQNAKNPEHDFKRALDIHNPRHPKSYEDKVYKAYNKLKNEN